MFHQDLPTAVADAASLILGSQPFPARMGTETRFLSHQPPTACQQKQLRQLRLATTPTDVPGLHRLQHIWETYRDQLPPRADHTAHPWRIYNSTVVADKPTLYYNQLDPGLHRRFVPETPVTILSRWNQAERQENIWMSTSDLELATLADSLEETHGHVLIAGLGMGVFPALAARRSAVKTVTVIEHDPEIIRLSEPYVTHPKVRIMRQDIWDLADDPPQRDPFDYCFFDIWLSIQDSFEEEQAARTAVAPLMGPASTTSVWCQLLNDRKRRTIDYIRANRAASAQLTTPGFTCYQCALESVSALDGLCPQCAYVAWNDHPTTASLDFPVPPQALPEFRILAQAKAFMDNPPPEFIQQVRRLQRIAAERPLIA